MQFGRHCQQLDELLGGLESTSDQLALLDFMAIHQAAQAAFLRLARSGGSVNFCELSVPKMKATELKDANARSMRRIRHKIQSRRAPLHTARKVIVGITCGNVPR